LIQDLFVNDLVASSFLPDLVIVAHQDSENTLTGAFLHQGYVIDFHYDCADKQIWLQENRQDTDFVSEYITGILDASGIRCDSQNPYEWLKGFSLEERFDFVGSLKCGVGTIPCGGICLPRGKQCRVNKGMAILEKRKNKIIAQTVARRKHPNAKNLGNRLKSEVRYRLSDKSNRERAAHMAALKKEVTEELNRKISNQQEKVIDKITRNQKHKGKLPGIGVVREVAERLTTQPEEILKKEVPFREKAKQIYQTRQERIAERVGGGPLTSFSKAKEAVTAALRKRKAS
jgi:hypothetical protein